MMYEWEEDDDDDDYYEDDDSEVGMPIVQLDREEQSIIKRHAPVLEPRSLCVLDLKALVLAGDVDGVRAFLDQLEASAPPPPPPPPPPLINGTGDAASGNGENGVDDDDDEDLPVPPAAPCTADVDLGGGWTALLHAAAAGAAPILRLLLSRGADPCRAAPDGATPLLVAAAASAPDAAGAECVRLLVGAGAPLDGPGAGAGTSPALHAAARGNRPLTVGSLLMAGADPDGRDACGWTPLMAAADAGASAAVRALLAAGAEPALRVQPDPGASDASAAGLALLAGHSQLADALRVISGETAGDLRLYWVLRKLREADAEEEEAGERREVGQVKAQAEERADELATFLHGVGLYELLPKMRAEGVTLPMLMRTSDKQLEKLGVEKLGDRHRILSTIHEMHKVAWTEDKPMHLEHGKPLRLRDLVGVVGHASRHIEYLDASTSYINSHMTSYRNHYMRAMESNPNAPMMMKNVESICDEGLESCRQLFTNLYHLRAHALSVSGATSEKEVPDLIPPQTPVQKKSRRGIPRLVFPVVGAFLIFVLLRKKQSLISKVTSSNFLSILPRFR